MAKTEGLQVSQTGRVIKVDAGGAWVTVDRETACGNCSQSDGCTSAAVGQYLGRFQQQLFFAGADQLKVGGEVEIRLAATALNRAAVIAYLIPLLGMITATLVAASSGATDMVAVGASIGGLCAGGLLTRKLATRQQVAAWQLVNAETNQSLLTGSHAGSRTESKVSTQLNQSPATQAPGNQTPALNTGDER